MEIRCKTLIKTAIFSRLTLLILQVVLNAAFQDHDADAYKKPRPKPQNDLEKAIYFLFEGLERWDGQYFLNIAEYGYVYEKSLAFFPLFPLLTQVVANSLLLPFHAFLNYHILLLLSASILNFAFFLITVLLLYDLSCSIRDEPWAYKTALLFCFNPASIFFSAAYSEAVFACLTFGAMHQYQKCHYNVSALLFGLATFTRSNGAINAGYIIYGNIVLPLFLRWTGCQCASSLWNICVGILRTCIVVAPFAAFQWYAYKLYCEWPPPQLSKSSLRLTMKFPDEYVALGQYTPWCDLKYPIAYTYVQEHYWDVGFLKYYNYKQIPNFILATPAIVLCFHGIFSYAIHILNLFNKGIFSKKDLAMLPFLVHCSFLLVFGITSMHVQVVTRLLASSSPALCWFAADLLPNLQVKKPGAKQRKKRSLGSEFIPISQYCKVWKRLKLKGKLVLIYFLSYYVIGTGSFANFLPWT